MKHLHNIIYSGLFIFVLQIGIANAEKLQHVHAKKTVLENEQKSFWTCSMHPQIMLPKAGKCPICGMALIPVTDDVSADSDMVSLKLSKNAEKLAEIQTTKVEKKAVSKEIHLVGSIDFDETRLTHITAWVPGRIDRMFVDYTGITVKKGDHMFELYSPELISAQEELIQASKSIVRLKNSTSTLVANSTKRSLQAAEDKLLLLGLTEKQVKDIKIKEEVEDKVTIYAPTEGVVVERNATEGMYVKEGSRVYSIANLENLWVYLDAYESDLPWIRYGQKVIFNTQALPGVSFNGIVSFISPIVDSKTRTTKVRVNVDNSSGLLKPGLFVNGIIKANIYSEGKVFEEFLKGKHVCPMHPEIIENKAGKCPICEMDLVKAEEIGTFKNATDIKLPLIIPISAVLHTGKRSIVYVKNEEAYELREITLGPKTDAFYIVKSGLHEGELVVTNGAFKIDADLQIKGKKSMMNPDAMKLNIQHNHGKNEIESNTASKEDHRLHKKVEKPLPDDLKSLIESYLDLSEALASDNISTAKEVLRKFKEKAYKQEYVSFPTNLFKSKDDIEELRASFGKLTNLLLPVVENYKISAYKAHCPMALSGKGAFWLQRKDKVRNPYFGASMLACGSIEGEL